MQPDPNIQSSNSNPPPGGAPPPLLPQPPRKPGFERTLSILLSLCLALFLCDAVLALADDSLILFFNSFGLTVIRGMVFCFAFVMAVVIYVMMGLTPMIPKRLLLPVALFTPVTALISLPLLIYHFDRFRTIGWVTSLCQVIFAFLILFWAQGGFKFRWPLVAENKLGARRFSRLNLSVFVLVNLFILLPAVIGYLAFCSALAVNHFSDGFLALRPGGLTVQVRKYVRADGKTIQLVPMSHIGDSHFYRELSESFPTNAIILMEGVTDDQNLLTNKITYQRMAKSLGLAEQENEFDPPGELVHADVDVSEFSAETINLLNLIMLFHAKGVNGQTLLNLTQYTPPPHFEKQLHDDLLTKRNRHLLEEIDSQLLESEDLIVPWGAAHIPEIAKEIQRAGFRLKETQEFTAIQFGSGRNKNKSAGEKRD